MTVTPAAAPAAQTAADFTPEQLELRERARRFVEDVLIPNEELAERSGGHIPDELKARIKREAIEARLSGGLHAVEHGGQGWSKVEWFLVEEQLGRSTNALSWHMPGAYNVLANGSPEQIDRFRKLLFELPQPPGADLLHHGKRDVECGEAGSQTHSDAVICWSVMRALRRIR